MAGHSLLVHPDVEAWVRAQPKLRRRIDWLLFELTTRGEAGRAKGIAGPAARVDGGDARWRRSGVGGFHYYAWWFPTSEWDGVADSKSIVVRAIRHHDDVRPLDVGDVDQYLPRRFADLRPLTEEQAQLVQSPARIRLAVGQPGTGKTGALIFTAIREAANLPPDRELLYVTLSPRLAALAEEALTGVEDGPAGSVPGRRVRIVPLADLLAEWSGGRSASTGRREAAASEDDEERAFLTFVAGFAPRELVVWGDSARALWAEVRAYVLGAALPFPLRGIPASNGPILDERSYQRERERLIGARAARAAWRAARLFVDRRDLPSVQREAWTALERLRAGALDGTLASLGGLIVDEIQDLTLLQIAVLAEAARRCGSGPGGGTPRARLPREPLFVAAGDESQIVHPSGFDWGRCKDLLTARLGSQPEEVMLRVNQRSAAPLVEVVNRTSLLYDDLPKEYRPRSPAHAEKTDAPSGDVVLATVHPGDDELTGWLELLAETPHNAIIADDRIDPRTLAPQIGEARFRDLLFTPGQVKGLDRQYVVIWDASRTLRRLREEVDAARGKGRQPRFLVARTAIDELRVAVSRATETIVFLDPPDVETDPLLAGLRDLARQRSIAFLRDRLEERNADPRARALGFLGDADDLLERDLDRARRTLVRVEAALAELGDPARRREPLERTLEVRQRAADALVRQGRYAEAGEQFQSLEPVCRELGKPARADRYAALARRYREAAPGEEWSAATLAIVLGAYLDALEDLPEEDGAADPCAQARAWLEEAVALSRGDEVALRSLLISAHRLAELSGDAGDRQAAGRLGQVLAERLLATGAWGEALELLRKAPDPPPEALARCYEGLKAWREAAEARLAADQPAEALEDYRRAAAFREAAELAGRLEQGDQAGLLGLLAGLDAALDSLREADLDAVTEGEAHSLARRLREAADRLARRRRGGQARGPGQACPDAGTFVGESATPYTSSRHRQ